MDGNNDTMLIRRASIRGALEFQGTVLALDLRGLKSIISAGTTRRQFTGIRAGRDEYRFRLICEKRTMPGISGYVESVNLVFS